MYVLRGLYVTHRVWIILWATILLSVISYFWTPLFTLVQLGLLAFIILLGYDLYILFRTRDGITIQREVPERLSNGDENTITLHVESRYSFPVSIQIIDELPNQLQHRTFGLQCNLIPHGIYQAPYTIRPLTRGAYHFGATNVFVSSPLRLINRRIRLENEKVVPVFPAFLQMRRYQLMAMSDRLMEAGVKQIRRVGHTMEFDRIRPYVTGDDYRTINWRATARRRDIMINTYQDERAQDVYSIIDAGRSMQMPFNGMSLLDHAINAALVISNIALQKQDRAGLITFSKRLDAMIRADKKRTQLEILLQILYNQTTSSLESDFEHLYAMVARNIPQRSLIILYTNFETLSGLKRQLPYLRRLASRHLLVTVFFQNTELYQVIKKPAHTVEDIYIKTAAEQFAFEKHQIIKELKRYPIHPVLTTPKALTVETINKYLELKARHLL